MPAEREHHSSKRNRYTLVFVPNEDAARAKNFRFALWQFVLMLMVGGVILAGSLFGLLIYTPVGALLPIKNPELENRYSKELIAINQRMANVMGQLVELRTYNIKLRQALGEHAVSLDSGDAKSKNSAAPANPAASPKRSESNSPATLSEGYALQLISNARETKSAGVSFPAIFPTEGYLSRGYEPEKAHFGLDIAGKTGTTVLAAAEGHVIFSGWTHDDGNVVILSHEHGIITFYKHNQSLLKSASSFVKRGEPIATLGNTGRTSSGSHLHFEIWKDGTPVDPSRYILNLNL